MQTNANKDKKKGVDQHNPEKGGGEKSERI